MDTKRPLAFSRLILGLAASASALAVPRPVRADMLSGGLLGALFSGEPFTGPRLIDFLFFGAVIFVILRLIANRRPPADQDQGQAPERPDQTLRDNRDAPRSGPTRSEPPSPTRRSEPSPPPNRPEAGERRPPDMYQSARAAWDYLRSDGPSREQPAREASPADPAGPAGPVGPPPSGSPEEVFLAGAKAVYPRVLVSFDERDFVDLAPFVAPALLEDLKRRSAGKPSAGATQVLLLEAVLLGLDETGNPSTAEVRYTATVRPGGSPRNETRREIWSFSRDTASVGASWLLSAVRPDTPGEPTSLE